jgi:hypothetical protein
MPKEIIHYECEFCFETFESYQECDEHKRLQHTNTEFFEDCELIELITEEKEEDN